MADETIKMMMGTGDLLTLVPENVRCSSPIVTAWQKKKNVFTKTIAIQCPHCVQWSEVPNRSAGKETACPQCSRPVRLNPFFIDADWQRP
jgi:DNA-directed RNA polymerase subunit RPC12/RpoP